MSTAAITENEMDKTVVDADGTEVGTVVDVHHGTAHVAADPAVVDELQTRLSEGGIDEETYAVGDESVAEVTDDRVVLDVEY